MAEIKLVPKGRIGITVEAEVIRPDAFAKLSKEEIERLQVWQGPRELPLSEFFDVDVDVRAGVAPEETKIVIDGDVSRVKRIGQGMKSGKIEILGSAGMHLGAEMAGGSIFVQGDADSWAGMEMKGGLLQIEGNAGDHVGSAYRGSWRGMTGGQIQIGGNARSQLGGGLVGGSITVAGNVENFCGIRESGGLIFVKGDAVRGLGAEMTGGAVVILGTIRQFCPGFVDAGREDSPKVGELQLEGKFARFTGDFAISKNPKGILYCREV
jgi:formylmethanofuran dehydrogenase subunit C